MLVQYFSHPLCHDANLVLKHVGLISLASFNHRDLVFHIYQVYLLLIQLLLSTFFLCVIARRQYCQIINLFLQPKHLTTCLHFINR